MKRYAITIDAHLDESWSDWFENLTIVHHEDGSSTLQGAVPDQARLFTVLNKIRDMNLTLLSVAQMSENEK